MHLIFTSILTEKRLWANSAVVESARRARPLMAASTLRSLEGIGITSAEIHVEFDESTEWARDAFRKFVSSLQYKSTYHERRLYTFSDWERSAANLETIAAEEILVFPTEDHFLVPGGKAELFEMRNQLKMAQEANSLRIVAVPLSHFPEVGAMIPIARRTRTLEAFEGHPLIPWQIPGGPLIFNKAKYQALFENDFTKGFPFVGFENARGPSMRLENLYYVCPRSEILRHFDSYGHIGLSEWPFNVTDPDLRFRDDLQSFEKFFTYSLSASLKPSRQKLERTLASEVSPDSTKQAQLQMAILKGTILRPTWYSAKWVASKIGATRLEIVRALSTLVASHRFFALRLLWSVVFAPIHALLGFLVVASRRSSKARLFTMWFLTYGSSIGYHRLFAQGVVAQVIIRLRALGFEVGTKPHGKPRQLR